MNIDRLFANHDGRLPKYAYSCYYYIMGKRVFKIFQNLTWAKKISVSSAIFFLKTDEAGRFLFPQNRRGHLFFYFIEN